MSAARVRQAARRSKPCGARRLCPAAKQETPRDEPVVQIQIAEVPEPPIEKGLPGPGMLADTIVRRWQDHLPLHRQESIYTRESIEFARSTIGGWHEQIAAHLVNAMYADALQQPYLCTDATVVHVQASALSAGALLGLRSARMTGRVRTRSLSRSWPAASFTA